MEELSEFYSHPFYQTLGMHAQQWLRYLICVCVCVCVCACLFVYQSVYNFSRATGYEVANKQYQQLHCHRRALLQCSEPYLSACITPVNIHRNSMCNYHAGQRVGSYMGPCLKWVSPATSQIIGIETVASLATI